jgi:hypothetical protein
MEGATRNHDAARNRHYTISDSSQLVPTFTPYSMSAILL